MMGDFADLTEMEACIELAIIGVLRRPARRDFVVSVLSRLGGADMRAIEDGIARLLVRRGIIASPTGERLRLATPEDMI